MYEKIFALLYVWEKGQYLIILYVESKLPKNMIPFRTNPEIIVWYNEKYYFYLIPILDLFGRSDYHAFLKKTNNSQNCLLWNFFKYNPNDDDAKYISISICIFARFG